MIKKLTYLLIILIFSELIVGAYYLTKRSKQETITATLTSPKNGPKMSFSPKSGNFKIGDSIKIKILVDSKEKTLTGIDSVIKYDPAVIEVIGDLKPGTLFPIYPILKVKKDKGEIDITGTITDPSQLPFKGIGELAEITVKPLKIGKINLNFDFTPGKTNDSNFAEKETGNDVLEEVVSAQFTISQ